MQIIKGMQYIPDDSCQYGSKAGNLIKLGHYEQFSIPKGWIIDSSFLTCILRDNGFIYDTNGFHLSERVKIFNFIENDFPKEGYSKIFNAVKELVYENKKIKHYVVRSSHRNEDGAVNSFAGQFSTFLNLSNITNIVHSILKCWRNSFSEEIASYLGMVRIERIEPCSIILQEFIPSRCAGVAFRTNEGVLINANWGLCKHIVEGMAGYDEWLYENSEKKWKSVLGDKKTVTVPVYERTNPAFGERVIGVDLPKRQRLEIVEFNNSDNVIEAYLPDELRTTHCLEQNMVDEIVKVANEAAELLKIVNYDVEWCYTPEHLLYILQIRPLTRKLDFCVNVNMPITNNPDVIQGMRIVNGCAEGFGYKINSEKDAFEFPKGGIILAKSLIGPVLHAAQKASGCIIQAHSVISHSAIIARELGLPTVGSIDIDSLKVGKYYKVNGEQGIIEVGDKGDSYSIQSLSNNIDSLLSNEQSSNYDLRPILTTLMFYTYVPEAINIELERVTKYCTSYCCEGFEQCDDINTFKLWQEIITRIPVNAQYNFSEKKGNFYHYVMSKCGK